MKFETISHQNVPFFIITLFVAKSFRPIVLYGVSFALAISLCDSPFLIWFSISLRYSGSRFSTSCNSLAILLNEKIHFLFKMFFQYSSFYFNVFELNQIVDKTLNQVKLTSAFLSESRYTYCPKNGSIFVLNNSGSTFFIAMQRAWNFAIDLIWIRK